ncbi:MAG: cytochrome c biogenesis protein CcsA [Armatimonadetes bacterium]|nr:cytochrome c biogenesis protein CcsA [Armatimonadota bacterium]
MLKWFTGVWIGAVVVIAFLMGRPAQGFAAPAAARIIFFHLPMAMLTTFAFVMTSVYGLKYLRSRNMEQDTKSVTSAELGMLFGILTTVTGAIFARAQWGTYWNWDPREISIIALLLLYWAYFALRTEIADEERRATLSAAYALFSFAPMIFLIFVMPRLPALRSLHPNIARPGGMSGDYLGIFLAAMVGFGALYAWIFRLQLRIARLAEESRKELVEDYDG